MNNSNPFVKATKENLRLRMAVTGPSGSGKTYTALTIATALGKTAVLDTERGSAKKYADLFEFDVLEIDTFNPALYIRAIERAVEHGYEVLVLDSLSHAWAGVGGILDIVEQQKKKEANKFAAWSVGTEKQNELIDAILGADLHIIGTMRSKTEYVIGDDKKPKKVGMAPVQRDGFEYEFDIIGAMDADNDMVIEKSRCPALTNRVISKPTSGLADLLRAWLSDGIEPQQPKESTVPPTYIDDHKGNADPRDDGYRDPEPSELDEHFGPRVQHDRTARTTTDEPETRDPLRETAQDVNEDDTALNGNTWPSLKNKLIEAGMADDSFHAFGRLKKIAGVPSDDAKPWPAINAHGWTHGDVWALFEKRIDEKEQNES